MAWLAPLIGIGLSAASSQIGKGKKPVVPSYNPVSATEQQGEAIAQNLNLLPKVAQLSGQTNEVNQEQLTRLLRQSIPGYDQILAKSSDNLGSYLKGELPADVVTQIKRNTAEKAVAGGYGGSALGRNLTARDLGRTSLDLSRFATTYAPNWLASARSTGTARPFDPASMFLTPAERIANAQENSRGQFGRDVYAAQVAAAPDPTAAAFGNILGAAGGALTSYGFSNMPSGGSITGFGGRSYSPAYGNGGLFYR